MSDNYGNKSRAEGLEYEDLLLESMNSIVKNSTYMPVIDAKKCDDIFGKKTTTKADGMLVDAKTKGISIKNPQKSSSSIQVFIPSKDKLIVALENVLTMPQEVRDYCELWFGVKSQIQLLNLAYSLGVELEQLDFGFRRESNSYVVDEREMKIIEKCEELLDKPHKKTKEKKALCVPLAKELNTSEQFDRSGNEWTPESLFSTYVIYYDELRRHRLKHSSIPQIYQDAFSQYINDPFIKSELFDLSLSKGFCKNKVNHAEYMLWCDSTNGGKGTTSHLSVCKMSELKNKVMKFDWVIRDSQTVWAIGPLTLQMKGSGKKSGASYHSPQFNASLNDLKKHCPDVFVDGDLVAMHNFIKNM